MTNYDPHLLARFRAKRKAYDIGESNQRQSDFYQGYEDAQSNMAMKPNPSEGYRSGYYAGLPRGSRP
jgi:hypothetical protein